MSTQHEISTSSARAYLKFKVEKEETTMNSIRIRTFYANSMFSFPTLDSYGQCEEHNL